ncbi:MAG: hypothetical protein VX899_09480 [Myxococcota bacterium]|nr:hypothetical protein [Myxococcota bacterium]
MLKEHRVEVQQVGFWTLGSLSLGLAPFFPEPHVWGKLRWVLGGAKGMQLMDFFDLAMHGLPWVMLLVSLGKLGMAVSKSKAKPA